MLGFCAKFQSAQHTVLWEFAGGNCALGCCFVDKTKKTLIKLFNKHFYPGDKIFRQCL